MNTNTKDQKKFMEELVAIIAKISKDQELTHEFLKDLFTPAEYRDVGTRWQIVKRLRKGDTHADIAQSLHVGVATVTRGSRELSDWNGGFQRVLRLIEGKK